LTVPVPSGGVPTAFSCTASLKRICTAAAAVAALTLLPQTGFAQDLRPASVTPSQQEGLPSAEALSRSPKSWVEGAVAHEIKIIDDDGSMPLRFRVHKVDAKGDVVRLEIETRQGGVARLVERNGQPLTAAEDEAEQARLRDILAHPDEFVRHHKRDAGTRQDTIALVRQMPAAMLYSYAPGQPQTASFAGRQVVLDFKPDPAFHPPSMASEILTGLEGRMWIDPRSSRMVRVEARVLHPVSFGWGIVGKIYPGGTIGLEQANPAGERWIYSRLDMRLNMRVVVKGLAMNDRMSASDFQPLPAPVDVKQAVNLLLAMKVPTR